MNGSCKINNNHGIFYPERLTPYVKNPTYIDGINKSIQEAKLDFNGFVPIYTTCIFSHINKECKNCKEGRVKFINFNNKKIMVCYPSLESIKYKIPVGLHIDIKLIVKGKKFEVSSIPFEVDPIVSEKPDTVKFNEKNWPSMPTSINKSEKDIVDNKELSFSDVLNKSANDDKKNILILNNKIEDNQENQEIEENQEIKENKKNIEEINNYEIQKEFRVMKNRISDLEYENEILRNKNIKDTIIIKNKDIYEEIMLNCNTLNTRVTEQFLNTKYSDYLCVA
jgi:hypothetical protein